MKIGDTIETAIWLDGTETRALLRRYDIEAKQAIDEVCKGFVLGPVRTTEKRPGAERVPAVPDHIQGHDVRLLVVEADILGFLHAHASFVYDLDRRDLERLRTITRAMARLHDPSIRLTDWDCDEMIDTIGPEAAADAVRRSVDTVH